MGSKLAVLRNGLLTLCLCAPVLPSAAQRLPDRTNRRPVPVSFRVAVDGWTRLESRTFADYRSGSGDDPDFTYSRLRLSLRPERVAPTTRIGFLFQPQVSFRQITGALPATGNVRRETIDFHQALLEGAFGDRWAWRAGRQELEYGGGRLIAASGWTYCGRAFDAGWGRFRSGTSRIDLFAGRLGQAANQANAPYLAGIYATLSPDSRHRSELYILSKTDRVSGNGVAVRTFGMRTERHAGDWSGTVELAGQIGRNAGKEIRAAAGYVEAGREIGGRLPMRVWGEFAFATGGDPANPRRYGTFDQMFPNNHFLYGIADVQGWRNMTDLCLRWRIRPNARGTVTLEGHRFRLADPRDFWYADNGAPNRNRTGKALRDPSGAAGTDIGREFDLYGSVRATDRVTVSGGIARFLPGRFVRSVNGGDSHPSTWIYTQTNYSF
ncbi:MAG: alginate export family protein [Capsulimonadales bacterium]|nr:alginate export family protein [Capsulimonadales bacterium]